MADNLLSRISEYTGSLVDRVSELPEQAREKGSEMLNDFQAYLNSNKDAPEGTKVFANIRDWAASLPDKGEKYGKEALDAVTGFWENNVPDDLKPKKDGFLDRNKGALGGLIGLGLIGMLLMGGGMGALLMALVGFLIGSAIDGGKGMLGGLFGGGDDKASQTPGGTSPGQGGPAQGQAQGQGQAQIALDENGAAIQDVAQSTTILKGRFTGEGENRQFIVESMVQRRNNALEEMDVSKAGIALKANGNQIVATPEELVAARDQARSAALAEPKPVHNVTFNAPLAAVAAPGSQTQAGSTEPLPANDPRLQQLDPQAVAARKEELKNSFIDAMNRSQISIREENGRTATIGIAVPPTLATRDKPMNIEVSGEIRGNDFVVTSASVEGRQLPLPTNRPLVLNGAVKDGKLDIEPLQLALKDQLLVGELVNDRRMDRVFDMVARQSLAVEELNRQQAQARQDTPAIATAMTPSAGTAAPAADAPPTTPQAAASGNVPLEARGPVVVPLMAGAAASTPNVDLRTLFAGGNNLPEMLRMPEPATRTQSREATAEVGASAYDIRTADGDVARYATFGITRNGRFVDPSKADVLIAGTNNFDGTFTITGAAARNERGEFPRISTSSDQVMLTTITGKSKEQLTIPAQGDKLNADDQKTKMALLVIASDEMARQGALNARVTEENQKQRDAAIKEALERQVATVNRDATATLVRSESGNGNTLYTFVQSGMLNNGDRFNFKFQGYFETVPAEKGVGQATERFVINRGDFVDSPNSPLIGRGIINQDNPYVMDLTRLDSKGETLVGSPRNIAGRGDYIGSRTLDIGYLTSLRQNNAPAATPANTPATTVAQAAGPAR